MQLDKVPLFCSIPLLFQLIIHQEDRILFLAKVPLNVACFLVRVQSHLASN